MLNYALTTPHSHPNVIHVSCKGCEKETQLANFHSALYPFYSVNLSLSFYPLFSFSILPSSQMRMDTNLLLRAELSVRMLDSKSGEPSRSFHSASSACTNSEANASLSFCYRRRGTATPVFDPQLLQRTSAAFDWCVGILPWCLSSSLDLLRRGIIFFLLGKSETASSFYLASTLSAEAMINALLPEAFRANPNEALTIANKVR